MIAGAWALISCSVAGVIAGLSAGRLIKGRGLGRPSSAISEGEAMLRAAFDAIPEGLLLLDRDDRFVLWNRRYADIYDDPDNPLRVGERFENRLRAGLALGAYPDAVGREETWLAARLARHKLPRNTHEQFTSAGRWILVEERRTADGGSIGMRIDITNLKRQEASFALLFDSNPIPMWVHDVATLEIMAVNGAAISHYGMSKREFLDAKLTDFVTDWITPPDSVDPGHPLATAQGRTSLNRKRNGELVETALYGQSLTFEGRACALMAAADMSARKRAEERVTFLAHHDALTELPNRASFGLKLQQTLAEAARSGEPFGLLCLDLDQFKDANDVFGHAVGDELLKEVTARLTERLGGAFLARVGGDEFNVLAPRCDLAEAKVLAESLLDAVRAPFQLRRQQIRIGLSVGVVDYPACGTDAATLLANADAALYRAKAAGRLAVRCFDPEMDQQQRDLQALQHDLGFALARNQIVLHYEPQVRRDGTVFGFEAVARWCHPERGFVPAQIFATAAERNGLTGEIGTWVLTEACREAASWAEPLQVAIDLSPCQFRDGTVVDQVASVLAATGLSPHRLGLEITEAMVIRDRRQALAVVRDLKALGVRIVMDDFGSGISSLSALKTFPISKMKTDRSFVKEIEAGDGWIAVLRAVVTLADALGIGVMAEGVCTEAQRSALILEGCHEMQGPLFGAAAPIASFATLLDLQREAGRSPVGGCTVAA